MRFSHRVYRWLLKLYPAGFRERYSDPMQRQFTEDFAEVRSTGGLVRFWGATLRDFVRSMPAQFAREIAQDTRHAVRLWGRRPLHTAFALVVLTIAIGANTGVFSVLNALLLRSLPFAEPDRLAALQMFGAPRDEFHTWRRDSPYLADAAMYMSLEVNVEEGTRTGRLRLTETSWNFFALLGRSPVAGRAFLDGEDAIGASAVTVISHALWQDLFASQPRAIGSEIRVNGVPLTVVGVAPPGVDYPQRTDLWSPTALDFARIPKTGVGFWYTIGRLHPHLTWPQAQQAFEAEAYARDPTRRTMDAPNRPTLVRLQDQLAGPARQASAILMGGVALLLLMACANIANLLLGRAMARSNELMIRSALGASRARLAQQLLTESVLLSFIATAAGLVVAHWTTSVATAAQPAPLASQTYTLLDWRVLGFAMLLSVGTGLVFGVGPALYAARGRAIKPVLAVNATENRGRVRSALIAAQIAMAIVLVTSSFSLGRAFVSLLRVDNGYAIDSVVTMKVSLAGSSRADGGPAQEYYEQVLQRLSEIPGVRSASFTQALPLASEGHMGSRFSLDAAGSPTFATLVGVGPRYFETMGSRVLFGRDFSERDLATPEPLVIVNDVFARTLGDPAQLIDRQLTAPRWSARRIVGVVEAMRDSGPAYPPPSQVFYLNRSATAATIVARVTGPARDRLGIIRDAAQSVDPRVPVFDVRTMADHMERTLARPKFYATATVFFGGLALLLAVVGVYAVVAYAVAQRTREMGIRLALGTTPARLRAALLRQMFVVVSIGAAIGIAVSAGLGRYLQSLLTGADAALPATASLALLVTAVVVTVSIWSATRQIARLDICQVLRAEIAE
jgi:putative ABC transport system permease protein